MGERVEVVVEVLELSIDAKDVIDAIDVNVG